MAIADTSSGNSYKWGPSRYMIKTNNWYYAVATVSYVTGKVYYYFYNANGNKIWSYTYSRTANKGYGLRESTTYVSIGGDSYYEFFRGKIKDFKFHHSKALTEKEGKCYYDVKCKKCNTAGACTECMNSWDKIVNGKCVCDSIDNCLDCPTAITCSKAATNYLVNEAVSPHKCVLLTCPEGTHKSLGRCRKGLDYVHI